MKSSGICTNNENNRFEVELKTDKYRSKNAGLYYGWFDKEGNQVVCKKTLDKISKTVNMFSKNSQEHPHWTEK
ncbi:hypothetical protein VP249E411_P0113 [Vibrio phage 249E41-1]|nr:hypothetical protein VP249E411_P0113 [Vibrio phage 249E41-1]